VVPPWQSHRACGVPVLSSCTASHSPLPSHLVAHRRGCLHWRAVRRWPVAVPKGRSRKLIRRRTLDRRRQRSSLSQPHNGDGHQGSIAQCPCRMLVYDCVNQSISLSRCCRNLGEESPPALAPVLVASCSLCNCTSSSSPVCEILGDLLSQLRLEQMREEQANWTWMVL
jgi:hypothetical protein